MSSGHNDPKLLYAIKGINAYRIENGREDPLTPSGVQTLSLLMVPTSSPFADLSNADPQSAAPEEDFYLHLHLPPELDLPLPATTQIYHQPPSSYLIPRWDLGPESGVFTRIEFPTLGGGQVTQDDVDTFETILAQCTAFLERAPPPQRSRTKDHRGKSVGSSGGSSGKVDTIKPYDPSKFEPGEGYVTGSSSASIHPGGQIVLVDEEDGSVIGELGEGFEVVEDNKLHAGSKDPVEISLPEDGSLKIGVASASPKYLEMAIHPAYRNSTLVAKAVVASRFIVTTSGYVSKTLQSQADAFTQKTSPNAKPLTFTPRTHARIRKVHTFSEGAADLSAKTVGQVTKYAQNIGAALSRRGGSDRTRDNKGIGSDGKPIEGYKPGLLNKSMMAFSTVADGIDQAGRSLLASTSTAATTVVAHRYGAEAGEISKSIGGGFKNVGLVYIDAAGVSRRAVIKSVAKGMVIGKVNGGGDLIVGGAGRAEDAAVAAAASVSAGGAARDGRAAGPGAGSDEVVGFGRQAPPAYGTGPGESLEGQPVRDVKYR